MPSVGVYERRHIMCLKEGRSIEAGGLAAAEFVLGPVRKKKS